MDYFKILNLKKEPFSNSPDPDFFFKSRQHVNCLQQLEISFRLRRGLNVIIGDVGTGKTTLCRQLIRNFADEDDYEIYLILDPHFSNPTEFLKSVAGLFPDCKISDKSDDVGLKEAIKQYLFEYGVDKSKNVIIIIDEGQKLPDFCLEILREFLNYETNEHKLLQIAIFAQKEFEDRIREYENFSDRISLYHVLGPMNFHDTKAMIDFRIMQSSDTPNTSSFFSYPGLWEIYRSTGGYPRKIINLCHRSILTMIIQNRTRAGWFLIRSCVKRGVFKRLQKRLHLSSGLVVSIGLLLLVIAFSSGLMKINYTWKNVESFAEPSTVVVASLTTKPTEKPLIIKKKIKLEADKETVFLDSDAIEKDNTPQGHIDSTAESSIGAEVSLKSKTISKTISKTTNNTTINNKSSNIETPGEIASSDTNIKNNKNEPLYGHNYPPALLGEIVLQQNETLWRLVIKTYGHFNYYIDYLEEILKINPHIKNSNHVEEGTVVALPAIPVVVKHVKKNIWWIQIDDRNNLEEALKMLRKYNTDSSYLRIVTHWNSHEGLKFTVLLNTYFTDKETAKKSILSLPPAISSKSKIFSKWSKDTVYYANPYLIQRH